MKQALRSLAAFNPWLLAIFAIPGSLAAPLSEADGLGIELVLLTATSSLSLLPAMGFLFLFKPLYEKGLAPWWLLPLIALLAGAVRSSLQWYANELLVLDQPSILSRVTAGSLSWAVGFTIVVIVGHGLISLREENLKAKEEINRAREKFVDLDAQLNWLVQARVNGLDAELARQFVSLAEKLNSQGLGPSAHRQIAKELRTAAKKYAKDESARVWKGPKQRAFDLWKILQETPVDIPIALGLFLATSLLNGIRVQGWSIELLSPVHSSLVALIWLSVTKTKPLLQQFAPLIAGVLLVGVYREFGMPLAEGIQAGLATWIWMQVIILISVASRVIMKASKTRVMELRQEAENTKVESDWLLLQLESTNIEVAKYLHAILQTRLMAYAMKLETPSAMTKEDFQQLQELLAKPMVGFGEQHQDLKEGLDELAKNWAELVEIEYSILGSSSQLVMPTLQVIREAVANSVKHGLADRVEVEIQDSENLRRVLVSDNGIGPRTGSAGLGTQICASLCKEFGLDRNGEGGSTFRATFQLI